MTSDVIHHSELVVPSPGEGSPTESSRHPDQPLLARLLADDSFSFASSGHRLLGGTLGLLAFQAVHASGLPDCAMTKRLLSPLGLTLSSSGALVLSLPGALILLTVLGAAPSWQKAWEALVRSFFVVGLLAGGFAPLMALFAWTGLRSGPLTVLHFVVYGLAMFTGATLLTRDLHRIQGDEAGSPGTFFVLMGFWCLTLVVGTYNWVELMQELFR